MTDIASKLSTGVIDRTKKEPPKYDNAEDCLFQTLQRKIDNFKKKWKKQLPADFDDKLNGFFVVQKQIQNPPLLIGGSRITHPLNQKPNRPRYTTAICQTWDELMSEMDKAQEFLKKNKSK